MSFRLGALLCLAGLAACSNHNSEPARFAADDTPPPGSVPSEPALTPSSLETTPPTTTNGGSTQNRDGSELRAPLVADTKGAGADDFRKKPSSAPDAEPAKPPSAATAPDNTKRNERDTSSSALTPLDQKENQTDLRITQRIRQAVMADSTLSFTAKNVKIITQGGKVTLRGPVSTAQERSTIEAAARNVAGVAQVDSQLEVKN